MKSGAAPHPTAFRYVSRHNPVLRAHIWLARGARLTSEVLPQLGERPHRLGLVLGIDGVVIRLDQPHLITPEVSQVL